MTLRTFLISGLIAGLLAGVVAFAVAYTVGEPAVDAAIALESGGDEPADTSGAHLDTPAGHTHDEASTTGHSHTEGSGELVSRSTQSTWGLLTGTVGLGVALGGVVSLVAAFSMGRMGRLTRQQSTAVVAATGFVAVSLVPFMKYPATPPAVGDPSTIGDRTGSYFIMLTLSTLAMVAAVTLSTRLGRQRSPFVGVMAGAGAYIAAVVASGQLLPTVNEIGDFPADTLWYFRRGSLMTLAALWATIGLGLVALVRRDELQSHRIAERQAFAASL